MGVRRCVMLYHGSQGGRGVEEGAVDNEDVDILECDTSLGTELFEASAHNVVSLDTGSVHVADWGKVVHGYYDRKNCTKIP